MNWSIFDPPAIIIPAPPKAEIQIQTEKKKPISVEEHFKKVYDTPWNKLQPDGRINIDGKSSASVSPYSQYFRSQVEDGIWPLVEVLYQKGYLPVSSCAGHRNTLYEEFKEWRDGLCCNPYVTIAVNRICETEVVSVLKSLSTKHVEISVTHSQANMDASLASSGGKVKRSNKKDLKNEYWSLNWMLQRNYDEWSYIIIRVNPWRRYNPLYVFRTQKEHILVQKLAEKFKDLPDYMY